MAGTTRATTYRLDKAVVLRVLGPLLILIGALWLVVVLVDAGSTVVGVVAGLTVVIVAVAAVAFVRPPRVLELSETGFRVWLVRGTGTSAASWSDVTSVDTHVAQGTRSIVVDLSGGRSTVIPVSLLGRRNPEARREIHDRLNTANGYRHLDAS
jgi:hypothetical protein